MSADRTFVRGEVAVAVRGPDSAAIRAQTPGGVAVFLADAGDAAAARAAAPADLVLIDGDVGLPDGWLERLRAALGDDGTVATVEAVAIGARPGERPLPPL